MNALEKRALRFQNNNSREASYDRVLIEEAMNRMEGEKDCNKPASNTSDAFTPYNFTSETDKVQQLLSEKADFLKVLGTAPGSKSEGVSRILLENLNSLPAKLHNNSKLDKLKHVLNNMEADIFGFNEHRNNLKHKDCN